MKKSLAIMAYTRKDKIYQTLNKVSSLNGLIEYDIVISIDNPKNSEENNLADSVEEICETFKETTICRSFKIIRHSENIGCWKSKLFLLSYCFNLGSDCTILLEDDVSLQPDALTFVSHAFILAEKLEISLYTISLYSSLFSGNEYMTFEKANFILKNQPEIYSQLMLRKWPHPWGIAFSASSFNKFKELGWNGNDQNLGKLLQEHDAIDICPVITRAFHVGETSSISGKDVEINEFHHDLTQTTTCFDINEYLKTENPIQIGITKHNDYKSLFMNDQNILVSEITVYYELEEEKQLIEAMYSNKTRIKWLHVEHQSAINDPQYFRWRTSCTYTSVVVVCIKKDFLNTNIIANIKSICTIVDILRDNSTYMRLFPFINPARLEGYKNELLSA